MGGRPNRRHFHGKKPPGDGPQARPAKQENIPANAFQRPFEAVAQPSLTITVPTDTPKFADLAKENLVDPVLLQTITEDMKFDHMTPVQAATIHDLLKERSDMLAQAKTGTGKTMAFLLPAIQTLINRNRKAGMTISAMIISPTRELAMQIAKEATTLLQRRPEYKVCIAIGGTNKNSEASRISKGCDILIGTPGRLLDHIQPDEGGYSLVHERLQNLDTLVLDEADRMLDIGFLPDLKKIISFLPNKESSHRQGMLFSATIADHVQKVAHLALSKDYKFISTIQKGEAGTHERVPQQLVLVPAFADTTAALLGAIRQELNQVGIGSFKAIVFAQTAALVDFYAGVLEKTADLPPVIALHSRMTQSKRTRTTDDYRNAANGILFATDVIARGMDFPSVTNVFQVGIPSDRESYIHRLGRTARAGAAGRGTFIVTEHEKYFPEHKLKDIAWERIQPDLSSKGDLLRIAASLDTEIQTKAYQSWLGYYKAPLKQLQWTPEQLVREANKLALEGLGAPEVPALYRTTVGKMGLKGIKGLVVVPDPPREARGGGGGGRGRGKATQESSEGSSKPKRQKR
ncbi:DEAD/DEAH box helicase [Truncatella angustata]|uniref:ATP-dependent RNA helicase n=1 Tax=Truncatella angustata TaxID=152316 RepID=A0A9P8ZYU7_9PEZI|nr:DEAD/DEAH box helicase [Truncatella angustata]KAH6655403.1 DEAD/DEAH box helicase [Truncatella angustata]